MFYICRLCLPRCVLYRMNFVKKILITILILEARLTLWRYRPKIIAVTGSVGKTTTKDAIFAVLHASLHIRKNTKSFNSDMGVPLTIIGCDNPWSDPIRWIGVLITGAWRIVMPQKYPRWLVLEVGADRPGDISRIARWLRPQIVVLTGVPDMPVHVEFFGTVDDVVKEKRSLAEHVTEGGTVILNADDVRMRTMKDEFHAVLMYGYEDHDDTDVRALSEHVIYEHGRPVGVHAEILCDDMPLSLDIMGALGRPRTYAALGAIAVAKVVGIDVMQAVRGLCGWEPPPGRMRILEGAHGSILLDDSYNSSPAAVMAALDALQGLACSGRKIALLGDMLELGKSSADAHRAIGERAAGIVSELITVGMRSRGTAESALNAGLNDEQVLQYEPDESERAGKELVDSLKEGDIVLVKGSQSMRMERAVQVLLKHPEHARDLLVRQDDAWLAKT